MPNDDYETSGYAGPAGLRKEEDLQLVPFNSLEGVVAVSRDPLVNGK